MTAGMDREETMSITQQVRNNLNMVRALCQGLDGQRFAQISATLSSVANLIEAMETTAKLTGNNQAATTALETALEKANSKIEELKASLTEAKKPKTRSRTKTSSGENNE